MIFLGLVVALTTTRGACRATFFILHRHYQASCWIAARAIQRQILRSGPVSSASIRAADPRPSDHIQACGLASTLARWENLDHIDIYGGRAALESRPRLVVQSGVRRHRPPIDEPASDPAGDDCTDDPFTLTAFEVSHRGPDNLGYVFEEKPHRPFLAEGRRAGCPSGRSGRCWFAARR